MPDQTLRNAERGTERPKSIDRRSYLKTLGATSGGLALGGLGLSETIESARAAPTVIDDFEDNDLSEYNFDHGSSNASVVSSPTQSGSYALEYTGTRVEAISTSGLDAYPSAGDTFSCWIRGTGGADDINFSYGVQDYGNRYFVRVDIANNDLMLARYNNGETITWLKQNMSGFTLSQDTWYEVEVAWGGSGDHTATISDGNGDQIVQVSASGETTWTSGGIGYDAYLASGQSVYFDYVTLGSSDGGGGSSSSNNLVIDDFEDGDISEYSFENGNEAAAEVISNPTRSGQNALELSGAHFHLNSTSGLQNYPRAGDTFSGWVRGSADIDGSVVLLYGVQDFENRYYAYVHVADSVLRIRKKANGTITTLAEQTGLGLSTETWYEVKVDWATDGTHTVTLSDTGGSQLGQVSISNETQWTSGGVGYNAHTSNGASGYFDQVTVTETRQLGSFDTSLDGWTVTGSNSLGQVSVAQEPAAVTQGDHALEVTINSDPEPSIENEKRIRYADLELHPCLLADVLPSSVENSDSAVTFRFRYHHSDPGGVEESHEMTVEQQYGGQICWDMSSLSATKLANPDRLEITWYPEDHPPSSGFDYNGRVLVDNVRLTDDRNKVTNASKFRKHRELERTHGLMLDQVIQSQSNTTQEGVYRHSDGTDVSYTIEKLQSGDIEETVDGETFRWEGGSA